MFIVGESGQDEDDLEEEQLIENFGGKVDNVQLWLRLELIRESKHWLPLRVAKDEDDDEIEDTDRIVLFDQLDGFLYQFQVSSYINFSSCAASAKRNLAHAPRSQRNAFYTVRLYAVCMRPFWHC